ncbi:hypothetical protein Vretimale_6338 [Volvox reticuliferus]|uniref:Methyltransferase FkbM domain-containing protein n=1 Tax=Volvox reticuliferus TaxID=1737510 RepID=A0A8J4FT76_9CHLO|nr:hypothetical protein Vretifemale_16005 [Volvox reticuliferus]GIM01552.1 hypothetical protein Vretimale_6338 [Volvox reticuliferus]
MGATGATGAIGWLLLSLLIINSIWTSSASSVAGSFSFDSTAKAVRPHARNLRNAGSGAGARSICLDTCNKARNGVCEEGRPGKAAIKAVQLMAYCDLGTDCEDCGPWSTTASNVTWQDPKVIGPVRFLKVRDFQVRVRNATVHPGIRFAFAYTDPQHDFDVSYHMENTGILEAGISTIVYQLLSKRCLREDGTRALVVDVGANFGWFAVMAARIGCRVIAFEPVPLFRSFLEYNIHLNDLSNLIEVRPLVVSHETGKMLKMVVPARGIWGTAGIEGLNIDTSIQSDHSSIEVPSVRLEDEIKSDVLLLKVDVEGWEWSVMEGAAGLLEKYQVDNIIMEYSPGVPERHFKFDQMMAHPVMLTNLISKYGYRIGHIGDAAKHFSVGWDAPLTPLKEVSLDNLKYDIEDVKLWKDGKLACPTPPMLINFANWALCGGVPEGLNPRSFRSEVSHNTNIWAAKTGSATAGLMPLRGQSGILDPSDSPDKYFQTNGEGLGMGSRSCVGLDPKVQVKHRCRCINPEVCGAEEEAVLRAVADGLMPQNYVLK